MKYSSELFVRDVVTTSDRRSTMIPVTILLSLGSEAKKISMSVRENLTISSLKRRIRDALSLFYACPITLAYQGKVLQHECVSIR